MTMLTQFIWSIASVGVCLLTSMSPVIATWTCVDSVSQPLFLIYCDRLYISIHAVLSGSGQCTDDARTICSDSARSMSYVRQLCYNRHRCLFMVKESRRPQCADGADAFYMVISHSCGEPGSRSTDLWTTTTTTTTTATTTRKITPATKIARTTTIFKTRTTAISEIASGLSTQLPARETRRITTTGSNLGILVGVPMATVVVIGVAVIIAVSVVYIKLHRAAPNTYRDSADNQTALNSQGTVTGVETTGQSETGISNSNQQSRSPGPHTAGQAPTEYEVVGDTSHGMNIPGVDGVYADVNNPDTYAGLSGSIQQEDGVKVYTGLYGNLK